MSNGADKPRGTLQRLTREATIFALLGLIIGIMGVFVAMDRDDKVAAKEKAAQAVHASTPEWQITLNFSKAPVQSATNTVLVPLRNGMVLLARRCPGQIPIPPSGTLGEPVESRKQDIFDELTKNDGLAKDDKNCRNFSFSGSNSQAYYLGDSLSLTVPLGDADQVAIERDYWIAYRSSRHQHFAGEMLRSLFPGSLYGFPAGLALWIFYRLVRFAVKG